MSALFFHISCIPLISFEERKQNKTKKKKTVRGSILQHRIKATRTDHVLTATVI